MSSQNGYKEGNNLKKVEMIGKRFGRLTVIEEGPKRGKDFSWVCRCDCGNMTKPLLGGNLRSGHTKSCGCLHVNHGKHNEKLYSVWAARKKRCYDTNHPTYKNYGARGISVCAEWKEDFQSFRDWAFASGYNPEAGRKQCTLDRINVCGNYEPANCRWVSMKEQRNNRRNNLRIEIDGVTKRAEDWAAEAGLNYSTLTKRYASGERGKTLLRPSRKSQKGGK